ncbi:MAG: ParB/RepB/Spo0J family partition protein [Sphingomonadales bacterium]|nr:ParB/RepB/Spo0J family partition protein [Sphingomonadales bacterium]
MARKQKDYLADLLADEVPVSSETEALDTPSSFADQRAERMRGTTLLGRESALARLASGDVRQVTQLLLDPARVRIWPGNARIYHDLSETNCRDLIDSILAEGGQKVPAVVRRVEGDPDHEYEVIAGTRRHFSVSWLRQNFYPDVAFVAQAAVLDDEAAFRLADLENRARKDVSDLERARNYADALAQHYSGQLTRMAERLRLSKGWLSKMIKVAGIDDEVIAAFASYSDVQLKPAYALAQALDIETSARAIRAVAPVIAAEQAERRADGEAPYPFADVLRRLLDAPHQQVAKPKPFTHTTQYGRPTLSVLSSSRQGVTLRLHAGSGADNDVLVNAFREALDHLDQTGQGLKR